jgi:hypothetical protein
VTDDTERTADGGWWDYIDHGDDDETGDDDEQDIGYGRY